MDTSEHDGYVLGGAQDLVAGCDERGDLLKGRVDLARVGDPHCECAQRETIWGSRPVSYLIRLVRDWAMGESAVGYLEISGFKGECKRVKRNYQT